ncbi:amidohydrolase [Desulfonema ishimotonii]|uniref:Amidohydrolase n=1 Tax=Desulfonema ishimotonii TaxID=45657 RepID=A0A401FY02_9BACT|nr:amidohydrolase [Desulfonema ishimotonii]GBC61826.1 amidohydrolase [Desulfonema ishimotonii]
MEIAILSARIFTGNTEQPWAEALAIRDGHIIGVGKNREILGICPDPDRVLELPGRLITPGLTDGHCHFMNFGLTFQQTDLSGLPSLSAFRERIREAAAGLKPGQWVTGRGWNHHQWAEGREPTRRDLDDLLPDNPAVMTRCCGHTICVNTPALTAAGITRDTPDPPGGRIDRDPVSGEPSGLIREEWDLMDAHIPPITAAMRRKAALDAQKEALRCGLTGLHSCETLQEWETLAELDRSGDLKLRVYHLIPPDDLEKTEALGIRPGRGTDRLWFGHVKLFADGSLGSETALMHEPYTDSPDERGIAFLTPDELRENVLNAYGRGWDVAIHAIGDRAVSNCLEAIASARKVWPGERRDRIEHVQLFRPEDLTLFRKLGVTASVQPVFVPTDWAVADKKWGPERTAASAYAWKTLWDAGIPLQFGTDTPIESFNPILGLRAAMLRQDRDGNPAGGWFPDQRLSLARSLSGYTRQAARTARREDLGMIAPGKKADLTIFAQDLSALPPEEWPETGVEAVMVGGEIVFQGETDGV